MPVGAGQRRQVTIFFADCRGFSALAEKLPPEELVRLANRYFDACMPILLRHDACIDKLLGDGIMAVFGAPIVRPDHVAQAVEAAFEVQREMERLAAASQTRELVDVGIAVHTGEAIVGNVGTPEVMDFTAFGDVVNVASRLQALAVPGEVLVTEQVRRALPADGVWEGPRSVTLRGRREPVSVYSWRVGKGSA